MVMFSSPLSSGVLLKRYKRFLADVRLPTGEIITAHTPNSGSMKGLVDPGNKVFLSFHDTPQRKLKYTLEIIRVGSVMVGVNTQRPNRLVEEAIVSGTISELSGYAHLRREVPYGKNSRVDLLLQQDGRAKCFIEVKNVTLAEGDCAYFPDAVTERGLKHLWELADQVRQGCRAVLCFVVQREDVKRVAPADGIDPTYGQALRQVFQQGVEVLAYQARVTPQSIELTRSLPMHF